MDVEGDTTVTGTAQCLFHDKWWRNKFQHIINELQAKLSRKYTCKISRIVCTCSDANGLPDSYFEDYRKLEMDSLRTFFETEFTKPNSFVKSVEPLLMECISSNKTSSAESRWRFLVLLKSCVENDFKIFSLPKRRNTATKEKMQQQNCQLSKYQLESELQVSFPLDYIQFVLGSKGHHIQKLCQRFNCEIRFDVKRHGLVRGTYRYRFGAFGVSDEAPICSSVRVEVYHNDVNSLADIRDALFHHIALVVEKREKHKTKLGEYEKRRQEYLQRKMENKLRQYDYFLRYGHKIGPANTWGAAVHRKIHASRDYRRKAHHKQKEKNMKKNHKPPPVLKGGICRNCLQPFRKDTFKKDACRYHPGFLVMQKDYQLPKTLDQCTISDDSPSKPPNPTKVSQTKKNSHYRDSYVWSCCGEPSEEDNTLIVRRDSHMDTGCTTTVHDYRLPKTCSPRGRKPNGSNDIIEDIIF